MQVLIINGSSQGESGNTFLVLEQLITEFKKQGAKTLVWTLANWSKLTALEFEKQLEVIHSSDAFVFATGTYWDSWGQYLQAALEAMTFLEGRPEILGKPASVLVTMHSVGGKEVLSRLQGVLSTMGFSLPPQSSVAISLATELSRKLNNEWADDFWSSEDFSIMANNLLALAQNHHSFLSWKVDRANPRRLWANKA